MSGAGRIIPVMVWKVAAALALLTTLSNCAPLVGAAAVVGADKVAEQDGDKGLF